MILQKIQLSLIFPSALFSFIFPGKASEKAALLAGMACGTDLLHLDEQRVQVTVVEDVLDALDVARGLSLLPELLARAAPEPGEPRAHGPLDRFLVHVPDHEHLAGLPVLDDRGYQAFLIVFQVFGYLHHEASCITNRKKCPESVRRIFCADGMPQGEILPHEQKVLAKSRGFLYYECA